MGGSGAWIGGIFIELPNRDGRSSNEGRAGKGNGRGDGLGSHFSRLQVTNCKSCFDIVVSISLRLVF